MYSPGRIVLLILFSGFSCSNSPSLGDPGFERRIIKVGKQPGSVEVTDVNSDGFTDILVANAADSSLTVLAGDGKGNSKPTSGSPFFCNRFPNDIVITDLDNDGQP